MQMFATSNIQPLLSSVSWFKGPYAFVYLSLRVTQTFLRDSKVLLRVSQVLLRVSKTLLRVSEAILRASEWDLIKRL